MFLCNSGIELHVRRGVLRTLCQGCDGPEFGCAGSCIEQILLRYSSLCNGRTLTHVFRYV
jgi:hypothetical protein